jgi:hypothetical protein
MGWPITEVMRRWSGRGSRQRGGGLAISGDARHTPVGEGGQTAPWMDEGGVEALRYEQEEAKKGSGGRGNGRRRRRLVLR